MTTFVGIIDRSTTLTIDGYSSAKTLRGVMHDIARALKKIHPIESEAFNDIRTEQDAINILDCTPQNSEGGFFVQVEEVPCASQYNENKDEMEYKDGYNYYFCTRVVK